MWGGGKFVKQSTVDLKVFSRSKALLNYSRYFTLFAAHPGWSEGKASVALAALALAFPAIFIE